MIRELTFKLLCHRYADEVFRYARSMLGNQADAEDATQEVLRGLLFSSPLTTMAQQDLKEDPAYLPIDEVLDLQVAKPEVNVNLPRFLINNALSEFDGGPNNPFA